MSTASTLIKQHVIDPEICIRCNTCEAICPVGAITHDSRNYVVKVDLCNLCMDCISPCPTGSIDNWRTMPKAKAYSIEEQLSWDELPAQLSEEALVELGGGAIEAAAQLVLQDPSRKVVIHCHMGVNRGPSAAFTALITHGVDPIQALTQIRSARPVAAILYSFDAVQWFARRQGKTEQEVADLFQAVYDWHEENPLDLRYCIQQIGNRYAA
jgi:ferredoxin